jgi:hypothetical protein
MTAGHVPKNNKASSIHKMAPPLLSTTYIFSPLYITLSVDRVTKESIPEKSCRGKAKWITLFYLAFHTHINAILALVMVPDPWNMTGNFLMTRNPFKAGHFVYPPLSGKPRTRVKRSLHTDWIILQLHRQADPKKLFASKRIRILDLMGLPQRPRSLPFGSTPWGYDGKLLAEKIWNARTLFKEKNKSINCQNFDWFSKDHTHHSNQLGSNKAQKHKWETKTIFKHREERREKRWSSKSLFRRFDCWPLLLMFKKRRKPKQNPPTKKRVKICYSESILNITTGKLLVI